MRKYLTLAVICVCTLDLFSQTPWSLEQCIDYALQNNTQIRLREFDVQITEINRKQSSMALLPSMNGGVTHGYNWGQSIDPFTNQFASNRVQTNNFYLSGNWTLFNGFQNYRLIKMAQLETQANQLNAEVERRNVKMSVTGAYLQAVLNYQLAMVQEKRMNFTKEQKGRLELLYENKAATQLDLYELIAQHALDSAEYLRLIGDFEVAKNQLKQLLNLAPDSEFTVELFPKIVSKTLLEKPANLTTAHELNALDARQEIADLRKSNSQAQLIPTISVNGSLGTGYSGNNQQLINGNLQPKPLPVQMQENFYQSAVLSLSVPIFNQGNVRSDMERNKVEQLKITEERSFLSRELNYKIAQLHIEIQQFQNRIEALKIAHDAAQIALEMATLKYQSGHIKLVDLLETQQRHFQAESELTQARFQVHFKREILGMYY